MSYSYDTSSFNLLNQHEDSATLPLIRNITNRNIITNASVHDSQVTKARKGNILTIIETETKGKAVIQIFSCILSVSLTEPLSNAPAAKKNAVKVKITHT